MLEADIDMQFVILEQQWRLEYSFHFTEFLSGKLHVITIMNIQTCLLLFLFALLYVDNTEYVIHTRAHACVLQ